MTKKLGYLLVVITVFVGLSATAPAQSTPAIRTSTLYGLHAQGIIAKNALHLKIRPGSGVRLEHGDFVGGDAVQTEKLNAILSAAKRIKTHQLAERPGKGGIDRRVTVALADYYRVVLGADTDIVNVCGQLENLTKVVEYAYPEALPTPAPTTPLFSSQQTYLRPAGVGVDVDFARTFPGGSGGSARIIDIEYSWNGSHTDLVKASTALVPNGTVLDPFHDTNHGTGVIGEMISTRNSFGVTGVAPTASLSLINVNNVEVGWDIAGALVKAGSVAKPGDVVIVEQQSWGTADNPNAFLPVEWIPEVYDAIAALTSSGVIVVEPAANGGRNLDKVHTETYTGSVFPMGKPDSGAILVGAGSACSGDILRSRMDFSNYGTRVNLQGPGNCVVTTGYGDLYATGGADYSYTSNFNGTSSASPVVAAAAADLSSAYEALNGGKVYTPAQVRSILRSTGTAQGVGLTGNIGPLPNLRKALYKADLTPPTAPVLRGGVNASGYPTLSWTAAYDRVGVAYYKVYRNGVYLKKTTGLSTYNSGVVSGTRYAYTVRAVDKAGHVSPSSNTVYVTAR